MTHSETPVSEQERRQPDADMRALAQAFEEFTRTTQTMEESYRRLEVRLAQLDRELAEKNRELAFTSDYLNSILESMSDGVIAVNTHGVLTTFNRAAGDVLGYEAEAILGRTFYEVFGREFSAGPGAQIMELRAADGSIVTVSERNSPLSDRENSRIGTVKVFQDLTEIRELRRQIRRKERLAAVGEMAATVAHEIRNPLGGIRGFAALLERDLEDQDGLYRLVRKITEGAKDLERVVNELLEFTRPVEMRIRPVQLRTLVDAAFGYLPPEGRHVTFENTLDETLEIHVDPDRMRQVFLNILLNAVQSMDFRGTIGVSATREDDYVTVAFTDTGCGMTPEQLAMVFSPFFTTKDKGTGLGLAVAAKFVELHGGAIEAISTLDQGSTFYVRIPHTD